MAVRFLKGLDRLFPHVQSPVPPWSLNLVLTKLMGLHFELLVTWSPLHLSVKVTFLDVIVLARPVGELRKFSVIFSIYVFLKADKIYLHPHPSFLMKAISTFHINQAIFLLTIPKPHSNKGEARLHTVDTRRGLEFYLE